jgi:hypothetical protein
MGAAPGGAVLEKANRSIGTVLQPESAKLALYQIYEYSFDCFDLPF